MTIEPSTQTSAISAEEFKTVFRRHPAGVAVVGLEHEGGLVGFTATSVSTNIGSATSANPRDGDHRREKDRIISMITRPSRMNQ